MFTFIQNLKTKRRIRGLIAGGILKPLSSFEEYTEIVREAKEKFGRSLFTNCYMMPNEIKRLIGVHSFYHLKSDNGAAFVSDEGGYYYLFLYVALDKPLSLPQLDRNMMAEDVYYEARKSEKQVAFEELLTRSGFQYLNTYKEITDKPQLPPEKYWATMKALEKFLESEGKKVSEPNYSQLRQFEKIYRSQIDRYSQKRYSRRERKRQADLGYLRCIADDAGEIYAIGVNTIVHGGAIAARADCKDNGYAPALVFSGWKGYYENMPEDPEERKKYMKCRGASGWIAVTNKPSLRLHKSLGLTANGKAMNQYVMPGCAK